MEEESPTGVERRGSRRWLRWLLILAVGLPLGLFALSNLLLGSRWARDWMAGKIQRRTTLDTTIEGASWSPWNGVNFRGVTLQQPAALKGTVSEPLVHIPRLRMFPVWQSALKGQVDIRSITLTSPRIVLPLEIVSYFATPAALPAVEVAPAGADPSIAAATPPPVPNPPSAPAVEPAGSAPAPEAGNPAASVAAPPSPVSPAPSPAPTDYIHLEDASFSLILAGNKTPIFEMTGIRGSIPVSGAAAESSLNVASTSALGTRVLEATAFPLHWQSPVITLPSFEARLGGLKTRFSCQLGMLVGLPFSLEAIAPTQPLEALTLPGNGVFKARSASANARFRGQLMSPSSWQAEVVTGATQPSFTLNNQETKFDQGQSITVLRGGTLSCLDARLVGDHVSFLGNATVLSNGKAAGVLRIVAPPETTISIVNQFFPGLQAPPAFSAMSTPQRAALDLEASGSLGDLQIRLGKNGPLAGPPKPPATATPQ